MTDETNGRSPDIPSGEDEVAERLRLAASDAADASALRWPVTAADVISRQRAGSRAHPRLRRAMRSRWAPIGAWAAVSVAILAVLFGPLPRIAPHRAASPGTTPGTTIVSPPLPDAGDCRTTVHGVTTTHASASVRFLPDGFGLTAGDPSDLNGSVTYSLTNAGSDPPRVSVTLSNYPERLSPAVGGRTSAVPVTVQSRQGLLEDGPPAPQFIGVYWKLDLTHLISVVGYKLTSRQVLSIAQGVDVTPGAVIELPVVPGRIIDRYQAVAAAEASVGDKSQLAAMPKLTSWTELLALDPDLGGSTSADKAKAFPPQASDAPWLPVWAVLVTAGDGSPPSDVPVGLSELVVVNTRTGAVQIGIPASNNPPWFRSLTDRDPSAGGCPGGSTARLPFGVLTRDEETYAVSQSELHPLDGLRASNIIKLTTIPVLNRADPGMYGGCFQQSCSLDELVWPMITVLRPRPRRQLTCPPPWISTPAQVKTRPATQYFTISVPDNDETGCGALPKWVGRITDLAPPS